MFSYTQEQSGVFIVAVMSTMPARFSPLEKKTDALTHLGRQREASLNSYGLSPTSVIADGCTR